MRHFSKFRPSSATAERGFTIMEIMVSMSLFVLVILLVGTVFSLAQRSYNSGAVRNELSQNIRVYFDRVSRELRQASRLVTDVSATTSEIMFQDGHDVDETTYIRYYLAGDQVYREKRAYYFGVWSNNPTDYVYYSSQDAFGNPPYSFALENEVVGEYFDSIGFVGDQGLIVLLADLRKGQTTLNFETKAYIRNYH